MATTQTSLPGPSSLGSPSSLSTQPYSTATPSVSATHDPMTYPPISSDASELPPMPVPYEDFQFSLNLPGDLDMNDLHLLSGSDRKAGPSNPMTPGFIQAFLASTPNQGSHFLEDFQMASRSASRSVSRRGSFSKSRPQSPRISSVLAKLSDAGLRLPPPPPDFEPPHASGLFASEMMGLSDEMSEVKPMAPGGSLFDSKEKSMLSNFLEGLDWNFDPVLPEGMPSFAAASEMANLSRNTDNQAPMLGAGSISSTVRAVGESASGQHTSSGSGSATTSSQSPLETSSSATSPAGSGRGPKRNKHNGSNGTQQQDSNSAASDTFGNLPSWLDGQANQEEVTRTRTGNKRSSAHLSEQDKNQGGEGLIDLRNLAGMHADMFNIGAGLDTITSIAQDGKHDTEDSLGIKMEREEDAQNLMRHESAGADGCTGGNKRELLSESEKRQNHILSEQRRRNYIREGFKELVVLLDDGRSLGARALGLASGFGSGVEDEGLDDRTDVEDEDDILAVGRKKPPKKAKKAGPNGARARGKGRGRGGSAGGGAGSKSAVLFQAVDLIRWLNGKNDSLVRQCEELEKLAGIPDPETLAINAGARI